MLQHFRKFALILAVGCAGFVIGGAAAYASSNGREIPLIVCCFGAAILSMLAYGVTK